MIEKTEATNSVPRHCGYSVSGCSSFTTEGQPGHYGNPAFDQASKIVTSVGLNQLPAISGRCVSTGRDHPSLLSTAGSHQESFAFGEEVLRWKDRAAPGPAWFVRKLVWLDHDLL